MIKLDDIIKNNIGQKKYLWISRPEYKSPVENFLFKEYMRLNGVTCSYGKPYAKKISSIPNTPYIIINKDKEIFFDMHLWVYKAYGYPNYVRFGIEWLL